MATPQPKIVYEGLSGDREKWLDFAEDTARLTIPSLDPRGHMRSKRHDRPHTTEGTTAVFSMASMALKVLMPPGVLWGEVNMPPQVWKFLEKKVREGGVSFNDDDIATLKDRFRNRTQDVIKSLNQRNTRSRIGAAIRRNLVEGSTAIHNAPPRPDADPRERIFRPEGIRIFPLRSHVVMRNEYGDVRVLCIEEVIPVDPMQVQDKKDFKNEQHIWTLIDYESEEIWRQIGDRGDPFFVEDETVDGYFVFSTEIPDIENYAHSYFWNYLRLIAQIDHAESSMAEAMSDASWSPLGVREGSTLAEDPDQVTQKKTGEVIVGQEGDIFWWNTGRKIADWAWVASMRNDDRRELGNISAKGIKDRSIGSDTSATAILEIVDEIETQALDLLSSLEDTLQRPLMKSEMAIHNRMVPLLDPNSDEARLAEFVDINITTGVGALSKQRSMLRFVNGLSVLQQLDPRLRVNGVNAADRIGEGMLLDTEGLYEQISPEEMAVMSGGGADVEQPSREETVLTPGGPQPPQPPQPGRPR